MERRAAFMRSVRLPLGAQRSPSQICRAVRGATCVIEEELQLHAADGALINAYIALPERGAAVAAGRGVVLMTDILGYANEETRGVARRAARAGLPTIVPDLFRGSPWLQGRDKAEYEAWRVTHDPVRVRQDASVAMEELRRRCFADSLGMIGFCFGGGRLMEEIADAPQGINPKAAVAFYPTRFDPEDVGARARCSLMFVTGDQDELVPMEVVEKLQETLNEKNSTMDDCEIQVYEHAGHAFAHHPQSDQDKIDSEIVLEQAMSWLTKHL